MSGHTKGPWHYKNKVGYVFGPDCVVAFVGDFDDKELVPFNAERWHADGRLIAAAPELLALARRIAEYFENTDAPHGREAAALIAKIEGK